MRVALCDALLGGRHLLLLEVVVEIRGRVLEHASHVVLIRHDIVDESPDVVVNHSVLWLSFAKNSPQLARPVVDLLLIG